MKALKLFILNMMKWFQTCELSERKKVFDSDLEFAKMLIKIPVVDRIGWLEEQAYNQVLKNGTIKELEEINSLIERVQ